MNKELVLKVNFDIDRPVPTYIEGCQEFGISVSASVSGTENAIAAFLSQCPVNNLNKMIETNIATENYEACKMIDNELKKRKNE